MIIRAFRYLLQKLNPLAIISLTLAIALTATCVIYTRNRDISRIDSEDLRQSFPDVEIMRPTDPPQSFNSVLKQWETDWPPEIRVPVVPPKPIQPIPAIPMQREKAKHK